MDYTPALSTVSSTAQEAPAARASWVALLHVRVRRALVLEFVELDGLDLGDAAEIDAEVSELFSRGGHRPAA